MLRANGRLLGGARSPTKGSMIWGVTVVMAVKKVTARKAVKDEVTQRTILCNFSISSMRKVFGLRLEGKAYHRVAVMKTNINVYGRRGNRSPRGQMSSNPTA